MAFSRDGQTYGLQNQGLQGFTVHATGVAAMDKPHGNQKQVSCYDWGIT